MDQMATWAGTGQRAESPRPRGRRRVGWVVVTAAIVVLVPFLFVLGTRIGANPTLSRSPLLGKQAASFSLPRIDQPGVLSSAELSGRLYVVNFWASWCVPCREENAALRAFYERGRPQGIEMVGILYADRVKSALEFRRELGGSWPLLDDPGGRVALDYGVFGVPETFIIDRQGVIMAKLVGAVGPGTLEQVLARIDAGSAPVYDQNDRYRRSP
ncbi:MAG: TlpA family protein disulfide reductase [Actinomycetota bacterium]